MSTKTKNVVKKPTRTSNTKPPEKSKIKTEDKVVKITNDQEKVTKEQGTIKPKTTAIKKYVSSPSGSSSSSRTSNTSTNLKKAETKTKPSVMNKTSSGKKAPSGEIKVKPSVLTNHRAPSTPSKVTKTLFFPTKQMYTNALKTTIPTPTDRERHKTRVLSPSEVKVLKPSEPATERPRTATIAKHQIEDYDDDFDSYESDFEAYSSSIEIDSNVSDEISEDAPPPTSHEADEERKLDSGNYELPEYKHKQILDNIKESIEQENALAKAANLASLSDEGYEEGNQFVNFVEAKKKFRRMHSTKLNEKRGNELLSMIRLDVRNFTLFEMLPVPYETFIKKFGKENALQSAAQTGDDDLSEETQTDLIDREDVWTQFPAKITKVDTSKANYLSTYRMDLLGVGSDRITEFRGTHDDVKLCTFLQHAGDLITTILDERRQQTCKDIEVNTNEIPFSDGYVTFDANFLNELSIDWVSFCGDVNRFISVHNSDSRCVVCVWTITDPDRPKNVLNVHGKVSCATFGGDDLIIAGLHEGLMVVWDLNQSDDLLNGTKTPAFVSNVESGHCCRITAIAYAKDGKDAANGIGSNHDSQVYSLHEDGTLIIWSVVILQNPKRKTVSLSQNTRVSLTDQHRFEHLQCTAMIVNPLDSNHVFVATNYGHVLHCVPSGSKVNPKIYMTRDVSQANCLAPCPFSPLYFLSGYENGNVVLFSRNTDRPLMIMCGGNDNERGLETIEWSNNKPCVFYTKDSDSNVHVWDLTLSDIFPTYSVSFKEKINFIRLSPGTTKDSAGRRSYMLVVTENKSINLHLLNKEHGPQSLGGYEDDVRKFLNYVDRL